MRCKGTFTINLFKPIAQLFENWVVCSLTEIKFNKYVDIVMYLIDSNLQYVADYFLPKLIRLM
jgi:hypothetical protein